MVEVAAFDFDGTLTRRDTLLPFLARVCGRPAVARALAAHAGALGSAMVGAGDRDRAKARVLSRLLAGRAVADLEPLVEGFAERVFVAGLRPQTVARARWHLDQGHHVIVVSASPELYVSRVAERLGVHAALATRLQVDAAGLLTGSLLGANVRGPEKARRLHEHLEGFHGDARGSAPRIWAYGDSSGDADLLAIATVAVRVTRRGLVTLKPRSAPGQRPVM